MTKEELTCKQGSAGPSTFTPLIHAAQTGEQIFFVDSSLLCLTQFIGKDVQHELTVTLSVDVTVCLQIQVSLQLRSVDEVSVVGKADSVWAVHIEGLGLRSGTAASSGVSQMGNAHRPRKVGDLGTVVKDLGSHAVGLQLVDTPSRRAGGNASGILTTVYSTEKI